MVRLVLLIPALLLATAGAHADEPSREELRKLERQLMAANANAGPAIACVVVSRSDKYPRPNARWNLANSAASTAKPSSKKRHPPSNSPISSICPDPISFRITASRAGSSSTPPGSCSSITAPSTGRPKSSFTCREPRALTRTSTRRMRQRSGRAQITDPAGGAQANPLRPRSPSRFPERSERHGRSRQARPRHGLPVCVRRRHGSPQRRARPHRFHPHARAQRFRRAVSQYLQLRRCSRSIRLSIPASAAPFS